MAAILILICFAQAKTTIEKINYYFLDDFKRISHYFPGVFRKITSFFVELQRSQDDESKVRNKLDSLLIVSKKKLIEENKQALCGTQEAAIERYILWFYWFSLNLL
jgi:hypothetical protein